MNTLPDAVFWLRAIGVPALQALAIIAMIALLAPRLWSGRAQRAVWLAGFSAMALVLAGHVAGMDRRLANWLQPRSELERTFRVQTNLPVSVPAAAALPEAALLAAGPDNPASQARPGIEYPEAPLWWPAWVWLAGVGVVVGRKLVWRGMFVWWWRRSRKAVPPSVQEEIQRVSTRLGLRRPVRAVEIPGLIGPIAFGVFRPTIGLPAGFAATHSVREREAMLAHELAHLAARDPVWLALADGVCAVLWWLPPVWWAQRRLRAACEAAADEASLVVEDGPSVLADCLVTLATRLPRSGAFGVLGMALFRSDLGRRVERLLALRASGSRPVSGRRLAALGSVAAFSAAALAVGSSAWTLPANGASQPTLLALAQEALVSATQGTGAAINAPAQPGPSASRPEATGSASPAARLPSTETAGGSTASSAQASGDSDSSLIPSERAASVAEGRWMELDVRFVEPPDRIRECMDVLTRRLFALGEFSRVQCEQVADGICVRLEFREDSEVPGTGAGLLQIPGASPSPGGAGGSGFVAALKAVVEQRGRFEFRRVHPDSDGLLASDQVPDGYEVLAGTESPGTAKPRYVVEGRTAGGLTEGHILAARAVQDSGSWDWRVSVEFTEGGAALFADLTRDAVGRRIALVLDGEVLTAPVVRDAILGGRCEISGRYSRSDAGRVAALLQRPLPVELKLASMRLPIQTAGRSGSTDGPVYSVNAVGYVNFDTVAPTNAAPPVVPKPPSVQPDPGAATSAAAQREVDVGHVGTLVQDARLLYELGKIGEAKVKLERALREQPDHPAAKHYLSLVQEVESRGSEQTGPPQAPSAEPGSLATALFTRTYRLDANTVAQSLETLLGKPYKDLTPVEAVRRVFDAMGVRFGDGVQAGGDEPGATRALFYNDRTGILLVRATAQDLETIESVIQLLNASPPQVLIEVKFVEVTQEDSKALGFDWYLGGVPMGSVTNVNEPGAGAAASGGVFPDAGASPAASVVPPGTGQVATLTGLLSDPQFRDVVRALGGAGTNAARTQELRGDQLDWPGRSATNAGNIRVSAALGATATGILTDPQYRVVLRALQQRSAADVLAAPRVTTVSGRQAQVHIVDLRTVVSAINPSALVQPGAAPGTNTVPYLTSAIPVGPTLDIVPHVGADGYTISLTVMPTITEFLGYDDPGEGGKVRVWQDGEAKTVALPLPRFRVRQMVTQAQLWDGQTLVLGGLPVEVVQQTKDKVPVLGDLPRIGRLFRNESSQKVKKQLLVFVTATLVDPAGNRVHSADNRPYDPNTVPVGPAGTRVEAPVP